MPTALKLTVHQGDDVIAQETFERDIVKIGRLASAHLKLDDPKVSRIHAVIEATNDGVGYAIIDMGSTEGTVLNGRKISKERLSDGDELLLGDLRVLVNMALDAQSLALRGDSDIPPPPTPPPAIDLSNPGSANGADGMPPVPPATADVAAAGDAPARSAGTAAGLSGEGASDGATGDRAVASEAGRRAAVDEASSDVAGARGIGAADADGVSAAAQADTSDAAGADGADVSSLTLSGGQTMMRPAPDLGALPRAQSFPAGMPAPAPAPVRPVVRFDPWGAVPNNLASDAVPDTERVLEVRTVWGTNVLDTFTSRTFKRFGFLGPVQATDRPRMTIGDDRQVSGWGPFQKIKTCDVQVPSTGLPSTAHVLAEHTGPEGSTNYILNIPPGFDGYIQRADGTLIPLEHIYQGAEGAAPKDTEGTVRYPLRAAETVYMVYGNVVFQVRYIRQNRFYNPGLWSEVNYAWLNVLMLAMFVHVMLIVGFVSTPRTATELTEDLFRNPNRFAQFRLTPEQRQRAKNNLLAKLKSTGNNEKSKGQEGKAGRKDFKGKKSGKMAARKKKEDDAQNALDRLLGNTPGKTARGVLMGSGGLDGELRAALGGVSGRDVGASAGLGGLGTRGVGKDGGGLSMSSVGLGALGTRGRGGSLGGAGYGEGAAKLGGKKERDINISAGNAIIQGSLDKELIRRVIKRHIAQIRYCYERELQASPGLFGKVSTKFVISAEGRVQSAKVEQTTLKNGKVERCVLSKIRTWRFPKPKGGGIVIVKYPFIFKTSG